MRRTLVTVVVSCLLIAAQRPAPAQDPSVTKGAEAVPAKEADDPVVAAGRLAEQLRKHPAPPSKLEGGLALFMLDAQNGEVTRIADEIVPGLNYTGVIEWSRDGKRIVVDITVPFSRDWTRTQVASIERGESKPLLRRLGPGSAPSATHDGEKILFMLFRGMGDAQDSSFWIMDTDGTNRMKLEESGRPKLSPGGRYCLITSFGGPGQFRLVDLSTAVVHGLSLPDRQFFSIPSWVNDDTFIAMTGPERGDFISLIDASDPTRVRVKEDLWRRTDDQTFKPRSPVYAPQSGRCFFIGKEQDKNTAVYSIKKGQAGPPKRFDEANGNDMQGLGMSPGGRYILFSSDRPDRPAR